MTTNNIYIVEPKTNIQGWNIVYIKPIKKEPSIIESIESTVQKTITETTDTRLKERKRAFKGLTLPQFEENLEQMLENVSKEYNK
jgi:hypothetical protein